MCGSKINWATALTVLDGSVPSHHPREHWPLDPAPPSWQARFPHLSSYRITSSRKEPVYVTRLQQSHSISLDLLEFIFPLNFFEHGSESKLYKKVHGEVLHSSVPIQHLTPLLTISYYWISVCFILFRYEHMNKFSNTSISYTKGRVYYSTPCFFSLNNIL